MTSKKEAISMTAIDEKVIGAQRTITSILCKLNSIDLQARGLRQMASYEPMQHTKAVVDMRLGFMVDFLGVVDGMLDRVLDVVCDTEEPG